MYNLYLKKCLYLDRVRIDVRAKFEISFLRLGPQTGIDVLRQGGFLKNPHSYFIVCY